MLRLIGLVVVVLFVLSLAHGERTGSGFDRMNSRTDNLVDQLTGTLADGVRKLGDTVFGPAEPGASPPDGLRALARNLDTLSRTADGASRRALAQVVLRSCPSLGLVCQQAQGSSGDDPAGSQRKRSLPEEPR